MQKFDSLAGVITDNKKYDTEIRRFYGIAKDAFKKPGKVLRQENFVRNKQKKRGLNCYVRHRLHFSRSGLHET